MSRIAILLVVLVFLWLVLSGHYDALLLGLGAASCLLVLALSHKLGILDSGPQSPKFVLLFIRYLPWLGKEILKSNLDVTRLVLSPKLRVDPKVIRVSASQRTDLGIAVFANSITLTPGTLSMTVSTHVQTGETSNVIEVHALTPGIADGLTNGEMDQQVTRLEGKA